MKNIGSMSLLIFLISVIMIGCGGNSELDTSGSPYIFANATKPMKITENDTVYQLSVQLMENGSGYPGQIVKIKPFSRSLGLVESESVETDVDGWAVFNYISPESIRNVSGQSLVMQAVYSDNENNSVLLIQNFVLNFTIVQENNF
jgi:hypothetical protein